MKQNKNKKKWTAAAATLAIIAALAGTFAWFTSQDNTKNHFETGMAGNDVEIVETFIPPKDWKPGEKVKKEVGVANTGDYKELVRVSFDETITKVDSFNPELLDVTKTGHAIETKNDDIYVYPFVGNVSGMTPSTLNDTYTAKILGENYTLKTFEKVEQKNGVDYYTYVSYWQNADTAKPNDKLFAKTGTIERATDGKVTPGFTDAKYVDLTKKPAEKADWVANKPVNISYTAGNTATVTSPVDANIIIHFKNITENPTKGSWYYNKADGFFYYVGVVDPQAQTPILVDSVELSSKADNSYAKMEYDLNVKAEGIQAFKEAISSDQWVGTTDAGLKTALEGLAELDKSDR